MAVRKTENADLHRRYPLFIEAGLALALSVLLLVFHVDLRPPRGLAIWDERDIEFESLIGEQEILLISEVLPTGLSGVTAPPAPPVPVAVPDAGDLELSELDLDAAIDLGESLPVAVRTSTPLPPPPPPPPIRSQGTGTPDGKVEIDVTVVVEGIPEMAGGMRALQSRIVYPDSAREAGLEGRVIVQFMVDERGRVLDPRVVRGLGNGLDRAAVAAVRQVQFAPITQDGQLVRVRISLPVIFKLR